MSDSNIQPAGAESVAGLSDAQAIVHYAPATKQAACGIPVDTPGGGVHTDERDLVVGCEACLAAAALVPSNCPSCRYAFCECFEAGFAAGLAAALAQV